MCLAKKITILLFLSTVLIGCTTKQDISAGPRIINIINFIRQTDYRVENSDSLLFDATQKQVELVNQYGLPATFLLEYDALINPLYQDLLKNKLNDPSEIGAWWEITQPQVEAAGMEWRGEHSWVSHANIAFSTGYTPQEREKLVDVYMAKFKEIFGAYPKSVGSWFIDAHTLGYMYDKYHIVASCNCKDQVGTDGYTLWGGYWNQAYYPSKVNAYMPAQTAEGQIPVPIFRMLGSDPIYQYDDGLGRERQGVISLEPVYPEAGMSRKWVDYFLESIVHQPALAFNYAQAGQENSFTWNGMREGLEMQIPLLDSLRKAKKIRIETLCVSGEWFKENYKVTPATAVTTLTDVRGQGNKTVWFNSRYYRANLLWEKGSFRFRDIHLFDENYKSAYYDKPGTGNQFLFFTLPVVDGFMWSEGDDRAGLRIVRLGQDGNKEVLTLDNPSVRELAKDILSVEGTDKEGHVFRIIFHEDHFEVTSLSDDTDFRWALELGVAPGKELPFTAIGKKQVKAEFDGITYGIACEEGMMEQPSASSDYIFRILPAGGRIVVDCANGGKAKASCPVPRDEALTIDGNRFVTLCIMIRTTPWEVSRDVKIHLRDEGDWHTLDGVRSLREAFAKNNPGGRLTWGFTMNALEDQRKNYREIRDYVAECQRKYGDEVSYFPGYFPAMYLPRERVNREMSEAIDIISKWIGNGYRPQSIMGGFLSADNLRYLAEKEDIHVAHAVIWSQHNIDGGGADGSPSYPFYPSTEHFCKPAQGKSDFIDCVNLDGWTMDFLCARRSGQSGHGIDGYNSRRGVGPIETYKGWGLDLGHREVMHTQSIHFDKGMELNGFGWVTNIWEAQMTHEFGKEFICDAMEMWVTDTKKRWPDTRFVTYGEFGMLWRERYKTNDDWNYHFVERGSGLGDSYNNLEIKWFMNKEFRLALLRDWHKKGAPAYVIDLTRYDLKAVEPKDPTPDKPVKDWTLINKINQKGLRSQDQPKLITELEKEDQELIKRYYPELF